MYFLYSFLLSLLFAALLPYFIYQAIRNGKYAASFKQRLGWLPDSLAGDARPAVWLHAVSVGEFLAARPLIERLRDELPGWRIVVSTTTLTGQRLAQGQAGQLLDDAFYFPFDWLFSVRRALDRVRPQVVVIVETELWPNFLRECTGRGIMTVLANGRISERSLKRYRRVGGFIGRLLANFSLLLMQSEADAQRVRSLGAADDRVRVCGNLKYDITPPETRADLEPLLALFSSADLLVAGSTAPGEEEIILNALRQVRRHPGLEWTRLVIAPRHPERFNEAAALLARSGFKVARRSEVVAPSGRISQCPDILLLDSIGELGGVYRFATVAFVGGSLVPKGGQNIVEPASFAKPIIVGPHTANFRQIVSDFRAADALVQLNERSSSSSLTTDLANQLIQLLVQREAAAALGARAKEILLRSRGATECSAAAIRTIVSARQ